MAEQATQEDLKKLELSIDRKIDRAVDDLSKIIQTFAQTVDDRFNKLEAEIAELNKKYVHFMTTRRYFSKKAR